MRSRRRHGCTCHTPFIIIIIIYEYSAVFIFLLLLCDLLLKKNIYIYIYQYVYSAGAGPLTRIDLLLLNEISFYETDNRSEKNVYNRGSYCTTRDTLQCWDLTDTYCTVLYLYYYRTV